MSIISQKNLECELVRSQHTFPLCVYLFQRSPDKSAPFLGILDVWLSLCMVESYFALDVTRTWVTMVSRSVPESKVISIREWCQFLKKWHVGEQRSQPLNAGCPAHAEISSTSLNLLIMLQTAVGKIPIFSAILC